jgi:arsenite/tail-anchored protein-transporting ATPase
MRVIVHTGKGGVGKTSISAATALRCAEMGLKTIVISTDTAHSLGDSFDTKIGPEPTYLAPNLWGQEVDTRYSMDKYWGKIQTYMTALLSRKDIDEIVAEEVMILPGLEEGAHLLWINQYFQENEYDMLIVDAAPTAETLRLLSLPDVTRWWVEKIISITRGVSRVVRPINSLLRRKQDGVPDDSAWDQVKNLFDMLDQVRVLLTNPEIASMRLVVNPEKMVIKETQRTYTYLNLYGYVTDALICNKIIPDSVTDPYFQQTKDRQRENIEYIKEAFGTLPMLRAPIFQTEVGGMDSLRRLADEIYQDRDPSKLMSTGTAHKFESQTNGDYILRVPIGFAAKEDVDLYRSSDEITLRVGPYRRNIVLPTTLYDMEIADAKFSDHNLNIRFLKPAGKAKNKK